MVVFLWCGGGGVLVVVFLWRCFCGGVLVKTHAGLVFKSKLNQIAGHRSITCYAHTCYLIKCQKDN